MIFDIFGSGNSKNPFPGYELKIGELCSLPATSGAGIRSARELKIPAGCIPLCVKVEPEFKANSGKGETSSLMLQVYDNNNKSYYACARNGAGWISGGSSDTQYLCPVGAYNGDLEAASAIKSIFIFARNSQIGLYSDYFYGKMSVTMWLEKIGGGALKCSKNPFVKPLFELFKKIKNGQKWGAKHDI